MTWADIPVPKFTNVRMPEVSACQRKARELEASDLESSLDEVDVDRIVAAVLRGEAALTPREFRFATALIFDSRIAEHNPQFTERLMELGGASQRFWQRLFDQWVFWYCPSASLGSLVRLSLKKNRHRLLEKQQSLSDKTALLESKLSSGVIVEELLVNKNAELAKLIGIENGNARYKLGFEITQLLAKSLVDQPSEGNLQRFLDLYVMSGKIESAMRTPVYVGLIQGAKKLPPDNHIVKKCVSVISTTFSDPRLNSADWQVPDEYLGGAAMREDCMAVVRKWNVFKSINIFFEIIEKTTTGEGHRHQFPLRKQFWLGYFKQNAVTEAWVLLGRKAGAYVRELRASGDQEVASLDCGKLTGAQNGQSVLVMRVGELTIVEWSHSGACRVWLSNDPKAPRLHQATTDRTELMTESLDRITHDHRGNWQQPLHTIIRTRGNVRMRL